MIRRIDATGSPPTSSSARMSRSRRRCGSPYWARVAAVAVPGSIRPSRR